MKVLQNNVGLFGQLNISIKNREGSSVMRYRSIRHQYQTWRSSTYLEQSPNSYHAQHQVVTMSNELVKSSYLTCENNFNVQMESMLSRKCTLKTALNNLHERHGDQASYGRQQGMSRYRELDELPSRPLQQEITPGISYIKSS